MLNGVIALDGGAATVVLSEICNEMEKRSRSNTVLTLAVNALNRNRPAWTPSPPVPMNSGAPVSLFTVCPVVVREARSS